MFIFQLRGEESETSAVKILSLLRTLTFPGIKTPSPKLSHVLFCLGGTQVDSPKGSTTGVSDPQQTGRRPECWPWSWFPPGPWALRAAVQWAVSYHPLSTLEATVRTNSRIPLQRADRFGPFRLTGSLLCPTHQMCKPCHL